MLEKNGKTTNSFPGDVTTERIAALQVFLLFHLVLVLFIYNQVPLNQLNQEAYQSIIL